MSLHDIQTMVRVAKDKVNSFGGYNYRTAEGILSAIKAVLVEGETIVVSDTLQEVAGQIFVTSTATITFEDGVTAFATGHALHALTKKGMDAAQITGSAASYARKYALSGLAAIDDGSVDPDASKTPHEPEPTPFELSVSAAIDAINERETMAGLGEYWKSLADNQHAIAMDNRVKAAKDKRKSEIEKEAN